MTSKVFTDVVRFYSNTDAVTFTDTNIKMLANIAMLDMARDIVKKVNEDYFIVPATTTLVLGQREYSLPADALAYGVKYVEIKFNAANSYFPINEIDLVQYRRGTDEATIAARFGNSQDTVSYDLFRNSIYILSSEIPAVVDGLKLWFPSEPQTITDLTDDVNDLSTALSTTAHGFPKALHELLARKMSIGYKENASVPIPLTQTEKVFSVEYEDALNSLKAPNQGRVFQRQSPDWGTARYGNNGYDL